MDLGLRQNTILITGGNSGIGKAVAMRYAAEGNVNIAISYHKHKDKAEDLVKDMQQHGNSCMAVKLDLSDATSIASAVAAIQQKFGTIHVLINNAVKWPKPAYRGKSFESLEFEAWKEVFTDNFLGMVKTTQLVVPLMKKQAFGRIVNVSSDIAFNGMYGSTAYGSLKSAIFGLTANLVSELSQYNILINDVVPSWTLTDNARNLFDQQFQQTAKMAFPTQRITTPDDIASMIVYLGSKANGHVNGEQIKVTGSGSQAMLNYFFRQMMAENKQS